MAQRITNPRDLKALQEKVKGEIDLRSGPKDMRIWPYNMHDGGGSYQVVETIRFLQSIWPL